MPDPTAPALPPLPDIDQLRDAVTVNVADGGYRIFCTAPGQIFTSRDVLALIAHLRAKTAEVERIRREAEQFAIGAGHEVAALIDALNECLTDHDVCGGLMPNTVVRARAALAASRKENE